MIPLTEFLGKIDEIRGSAPAYRLGGDGSDGTCDCVGLVIGAIRRAGGSWSGIHGSNYAWRYQMARQVKQVAATELELGWLVYKARSPTQAGYKLPDKYKQGGQAYTGDVLDYYHVGVVTSVEPLRITHCTTGGGVDGIAVDTRQGKWLYGGPCKLIDYDDKEVVRVTKAIVTAPDGGTVNLRRGKSLKAEPIAKVPIGTTVTVISQDGDWCHIGYGSMTGYMMSRYLSLDGDSSPVAPAGDGGLLAELEALVDKYKAQKEEM